MPGLLIEHLPVVASAPTGVKKLRELILQLAVMGKLVPQDPSDEAASELHRRCLSEREKKGKAKVQRFQPGRNITAPFALPANWKWVTIGQICHDWGQKTPVDLFTYVDVSAIDNLNGIIRDPKVMSGADAPSRARKLVRPGTVIYSTVRPYLLNVAIIQEEIQPEPIASTAFAVVHPLCDISSRYLFWFFRSPVFTSYVESVQIGVAYPAINDGQFFSGLLPLPPVAEQHRIVAKVDELMALCDRLDAQQADASVSHLQLVKALLDTLTQSTDQADFATSWKRIKQNFDTIFTTESSIDALKQTLLQLAVMGKLVSSHLCPGYKTTKALIERLQKHKGQLLREKHIKGDLDFSPAVVSDEDLMSLPEGWTFMNLSSLATKITDGEHQTPRRVKAGFYLLSARNVTNEGIVLDDVDYVDGEEFEKLRKRCNPNIGDVLISCSGSVGRVALVDRDDAYVMVRSAAMVRGLSEFIEPSYLKLALQSPFCQRQIERRSKSTAQSNLFLGEIKQIVIPYAPPAVQLAIVQRVKELFVLTDRLQECLAQEKELLRNFLPAAFDQAFRCESEANEDLGEADQSISQRKNRKCAAGIVDRAAAQQKLAR